MTIATDRGFEIGKLYRVSNDYDSSYYKNGMIVEFLEDDASTDCGGDTVYRYSFDDAWKGMFDNEEEREFFLTEAVKAIHNRIKEVKE